MGDNKLVDEHNLIAGDSTLSPITEGTPIVVDGALDAANEPNKESGTTEHITAENLKFRVNELEEMENNLREFIAMVIKDCTKWEDFITKYINALDRERLEWEEKARQARERLASFMPIYRKVSEMRMPVCQLSLSKY